MQWINDSMIQLLNSPISNDHLLGALVVARLVTARRLAPRRYRISSTGGLAFTAAVRVNDLLCRAKRSHARHCQPVRRSRDTQPEPVALRPKASATAQRDLPWLTAAQ